jgi:hypothetical protein
MTPEIIATLVWEEIPSDLEGERSQCIRIIAHHIREALKQEREEIIADLVDRSDGLKDVLPRDASVIAECAQMIKERT